MPKVKKIKTKSKVDYSTGPAFSATSTSRQTADRMYNRSGGDDSGLKSKIVENPDGSYTRSSVDSSPANMAKGGKMKAVKTYKKGGSIKDACYHKVKAGEKVFPSAYASGRIAKCRKMGAANYGKGKK